MSTVVPRTLVTGATGLIGKHLVERLLARGGELLLLIRPDSLPRHSELLARWQTLADAADTVLTVVPGDVERPGLGLAGPLPAAALDHVFHLAARYDLAAGDAELQRSNVDGTRNLLDALPGFRGIFHHLSSIAVAGDFEGTLRETDLDVGQGHPHPYHRTKFLAEKLVRERPDLRFRIYRPSAVVGDSRTGAMDRIDGPYYLFKPILKLQGIFPRWFPLLGYLDTPLNMVPVDHVARVVDTLAHMHGLDGQCFHVVDPSPPSFTETFNLIADAARAPRIRAHAGKLRKLLPGGAALLGQLGAVKYIREQLLRDLGIPPQVHDALGRPVRYDTSNIDRALAGTAIRCPRQSEYVEALWDYWLRRLDPDRDPAALARRALAGKVVLITGASSGIGAALALTVARAGARVALVARREPELAAVAAQVQALGAEASIHVADLSDVAACDAVVESVRQVHGRVDILVNNAGRSIRRPTPESLERWHDLERIMQINFFAPTRLIRAVLPEMRARRSGHIVNVLTAGVAMPSVNFAAYGASKAALSHFTDTLAAELMAEGINLTAVYPAFVRTPMMDARRFADTSAITPEEVADWIVDGIVHRKLHVMEFATRRRWVLNALVPRGLARLTSALYQVWSDDERPEFVVDRAVLKKFVKGRLF